MIVLSAKDIKKEYGADTILEGITFGINGGDRVGIVGANGAGKTTLLNVLSGEESATSGDVFVSKDMKIGYLRQRDEFVSERTVLEEMEDLFSDLSEMEEEMLRLSHLASELSGEDQKEALERYEDLMHEFEMRGGYRYKSDIKGVLAGMAFGEDYYDKKISMLSGGERTRLALAALLLTKPNILLLDEPTNHLDIEAIEFLEGYLKRSRCTLLMVTHDRYFLDRVCNTVMELDHGAIYTYKGDYQNYLEKREERIAHYNAETDKVRNLLRRELEWIHATPCARSGNVWRMFLLYYGAVEIVVDSLRNDSPLMHFHLISYLNQYSSFVSLAQVFAASTALYVLIYYSVHSVRANGLPP